jgi:hypothetical protein
VRDVAVSLLRRGHTPIVYSPVLGEVARELRIATVPVVDDLAKLGAAPDVIHGQHHLEVMTALLTFARAPAIFVCHGWRPWEEAPPRHPRILRYVAVDDACRDRVVFENGIDEDQVRVFLNFVDLERFPARGPLPEKPRKALVFSNAARPASYVGALREACERAGLTLDVLGAGMGNALADPGRVLPGYDVVFAKARAAIEALAAGTAVILCDAVGLGPMVGTAEFDRLRSLNFGVRVLADPIRADLVAERLARYDAEDAGRVSRRVRETAGREAVVDDLLALYQEIIAEQGHRPVPAGAGDDQRAAAAYLRSVSQAVKGRAESFLEQERKRWEAEAAAARAREVDPLRAKVDELRRELAASRDRLEERSRELHVLESSRGVQLLRKCRGVMQKVLPGRVGRRRALGPILGPSVPRQGSSGS